MNCFLRLVGVAFMLLTVRVSSLAQVSVNIASSSASAGGFASVNISLNSSPGIAPVVIEWTLNYSSSDLLGMNLQAATAATSADKELSCASSTGSVTCIVWAMNENVIANGVLATANFRVSSQAAASSALKITGTRAVTAAAANLGATGSQATLTVTPGVLKLACSPAPVITPGTSTCAVTLTSAAPTATIVPLGLGTTSASVSMPSSLTVAGGATIASFTVQASAVTAATTAVVVASLNGSSASFSLGLTPLSAQALFCTPSTIVTPGTSTCTVILSGLAPSGGAKVTLKMGSPLPAITMPASVTVAAGTKSATFTVQAATVATTSTTSIIATLNGTSKSLSMTIGAPFGGG
jgi:trimeric autotransporter adhesin